MSTGLILDADQITEGAATLTPEMKLTVNQVRDLVSVFRGYLGSIASRYTLFETFTNLQDTADDSTAAKLAACLLLWQSNQFDVSGFAATAANRTGWHDETSAENFEIFKYAFGLFWDLPKEIDSRWNVSGGRSFGQGRFRRAI